MLLLRETTAHWTQILPPQGPQSSGSWKLQTELLSTVLGMGVCPDCLTEGYPVQPARRKDEKVSGETMDLEGHSKLRDHHPHK